MMSHLLHLRTFLEAYRTHSLTKAAQRLNITQPAVSAHIQALESLVGKALFIRQARGVEPTPVADELACTIGPYLDGLETKIATIQKHSTAITGTIYIAAPAEFLSAYVSQLVGSLPEQGVNFRFLLGGREQIYQNLLQGKADLALTSSLPDAKQYDFVRIGSERLILVIAPMLATQILQTPVTLEALTGLPLIAYSENLPLVQSLFDQTLQRQANITVADVRIVKSLVCGGKGWSVLPDYLCHDELASERLIELTAEKPPQWNNFYLVWNKGALRQPRILYVRDYFIGQAEKMTFSL